MTVPAPRRLFRHRQSRGAGRRWTLARTMLPTVGVMLCGVAGVAGAQGNGKGFLFKQPRGSFAIRGGYAVASASSDVFSDATSLLTLDKKDFSGFQWGGDISWSATDRADLVFDGGFSSSRAHSEFRDWVDNNEQPIEQATKYRRVPLTVSAKYYLTNRGRQVGQFAYIPSRYAPYLSLGGGAMYYSFEQSGDFVDFETLDVFPATLQSSGWTPMAQGAAGVDYNLGAWVSLTGEARYVWAKATLDPSTFEGYDKIDLSGYTGTIGFRVRF